MVWCCITRQFLLLAVVSGYFVPRKRGGCWLRYLGARLKPGVFLTMRRLLCLLLPPRLQHPLLVILFQNGPFFFSRQVAADAALKSFQNSSVIPSVRLIGRQGKTKKKKSQMGLMELVISNASVRARTVSSMTRAGEELMERHGSRTRSTRHGCPTDAYLLECFAENDRVICSKLTLWCGLLFDFLFVFDLSSWLVAC